MIRVDYDKNKMYREYGVILDKEVIKKIKCISLLEGGDHIIFYEKLQNIITPIKDSFDEILSNGEKNIIGRININEVMNKVILLMLSELENDLQNKSIGTYLNRMKKI